MHQARVFPNVGWEDEAEPPSGPPGQTSQPFNNSDAPLDGVEDAVKVRRSFFVQSCNSGSQRE